MPWPFSHYPSSVAPFTIFLPKNQKRYLRTLVLYISNSLHAIPHSSELNHLKHLIILKHCVILLSNYLLSPAIYGNHCECKNHSLCFLAAHREVHITLCIVGQTHITWEDFCFNWRKIRTEEWRQWYLICQQWPPVWSSLSHGSHHKAQASDTASCKNQALNE